MHRHFVSGGTWDAAEDLLDGKSGPSDRRLMAIGIGEGRLCPVLRWDKKDAPDSSAIFRLMVAVEGRSVVHKIRVVAARSGNVLGEIFIRCPDPYQALGLELSSGQVEQALDEGVRLEQVEGEKTLWFFAPLNGDGSIKRQEPHLYFHGGEEKEKTFLATLTSMASLQTFSWKEGCVLDGICELHDHLGYPGALGVVKEHLDTFGFNKGELVYEDPRNVRLVNKVYGIEGTLPFAQAVRLDVNHPWMTMVRDFWLELLRTQGGVFEPEMISAEGAYTVAYPMALVGKLRGIPELTNEAVRLLMTTRDRLVKPDAFYLRDYHDGRKTFPNWVRGFCWYLLGHAQSLRHLDGSGREEVLKEFQRAAGYVAGFQNKDGIWHCFADKPEVLPDTAGSAGVGAAFAIGAKEGFLPKEYAAKARKAYEGLLKYVTDDGFMDGCSQSNKGGVELQESTYRVISTYALGMLGVLRANLEN